jgi:hypothetical protein
MGRYCEDRIMALPDEVAELRWTVDASVLMVPPRPPIACLTISLSLPPTEGSGVEVRELDPQAVPGSTRFGNGTVLTPMLRLTGTYDGRCLALTEPPSPVEIKQEDIPAEDELRTACLDPGGEPFAPEQRAAAVAYAAAQPDLGEIWMSDHERVLNVSFTGELPRHEQAIRALYPGPLCVVETPASAADLEAIRRRLYADAALEAQQIQVLQSWKSRGKLHVLVVAARQEQVGQLRNRYGPHVAVTSWLRPASRR